MMNDRQFPGTNKEILGQIDAFLEQTDSDGVSNRRKIEENQHIIRRVATTDKSKSYEDSDNVSDNGVYPPGIVIQDGRLIGFGIHIYNEDIYPLQSFEIYLRNCNLSGSLNLSGCKDLLFVDIYHNHICYVDVAGADALRILGIQDNEIERLDVTDLISCQGIDAGNNQLRTLDLRNNHELVELYINDNQFSEINLESCPKLKYFYCHNNHLKKLDTTANPLLRHLNATGNPLHQIQSFAPQRDVPAPLELTAEGPGAVGLKFNPVYNAQWKETGEWEQSYYAYPQKGHRFAGWYDTEGRIVSKEPIWFDTYGASRVLTARFS